MLLEHIASPADLRNLAPEQLPLLAGELREVILDSVSRNGGHLAASLGAVELAIALHYSFHTPEDKLVWDVGHQAYAHKLLTGRQNSFQHLRAAGGCSGFPVRDESEYDPFGVGHAGTAISAALGFAVAAKLRNVRERAIAVVGDGAFNCGISLEALNHIEESGTAPVIVLNDNKMSIAGNVGAIPSYLNRIITGRAYNRFRALSRTLVRKLPHNEELYQTIKRLESSTKNLFLPGVFFAELGIRYLGPVDGHDFPALLRVFETVRNLDRPVVVHVITQKGRGYPPAEENPEHFHGVGPFEPATGTPLKAAKPGFSAAFGEALLQLGREQKDVCAISAAMTAATGLAEFAAEFPHRSFDVGIAEEHAVTFAGALAAAGQRPFVALYSTFLQRAFDCIYHDVCLQKLPVVFGIDRACAVEDGPTHHGIYDLGFLRMMPGLDIYAPRNEAMLRIMLRQAYENARPAAVRYGRGCSGDASTPETPPEFGKAEIVREGDDLAVWALGQEVGTALRAAELLEHNFHKSVRVVDPRYLAPFDAALLRETAEKMPVFTLEDHSRIGGLGSAAAEILSAAGKRLYGSFGYPREIIGHGRVAEIHSRYGLTAEALATAIAETLKF